MLSAAGALADYWLDATAAGLVLHPISIVIQHDDLRLALQRRFCLPGRVFFAARLGHPAAAFPASPAPRRGGLPRALTRAPGTEPHGISARMPSR